jgi:Nif-specific regulatory protein
MKLALQEYERRAPLDVRLSSQLALLQICQNQGISLPVIEEQLRPLLEVARAKRMAWHLSQGLMIRAEALIAASRGGEAEAGLQEAIALALKNADRTVYWQASYLLGRVYEQALRYERALNCYRAAALTVQELAMNIDEDRYRESFLRIPRVQEVLDRYATLKGEVGKQARRDLASLNRSEQISRKMIGALSEIGQKLTSLLDLDDLLKNLLDLAIENVRAERGIVFLRDEVTGEMRQACARGIDKDDLDDVSSFSRSVIRRVAEGQTILTVDVGKDQTLSGYQSLALHEIKSILCVPMRTRGVVVGVIYLDTRRASQLFTEKERAFVESFAGQAAIAIENARLFGNMSAENERLRREVAGRTRFAELVGDSQAMQRLRETIASVLEGESNVLILGESGTGKELVARAIHYNGPRQKKKFVAIDCGALPENLLEAELFGYARGAFTGADRDRIGLIEAARGGTLFLDEITNTSLAFQSRLLRVLQEHEVRRVGENEPRRIDVRVVAATNADIKTHLAQGRFRQDLYYRLNVVSIEVPPLRSRREDIPQLVERLLRSHAREGQPPKRLAPGVIEALARHDWPGNVRELENLIERLVVLSPAAVVSIEDLPEGLRPVAAGPEQGTNGNGSKNGERLMIEDALRRHGGDKAKTARFIGWNRQKLYRRMKLLGIPADYGQAA